MTISSSFRVALPLRTLNVTLNVLIYIAHLLCVRIGLYEEQKKMAEAGLNNCLLKTMITTYCILKELICVLKIGFLNGCRCFLIDWNAASSAVIYFCVNCPCFNSYRAKLASLFGVDQRVSQANESFQYTAPKQPRKSSTTGEIC